MPQKGAKPLYRTLYFRDPRDHARIKERAGAAGLSVSAFMTRAALGDLPEDVGGVSTERARALEDETAYWRDRFERMAGLAQDMQAEILQLRQELRMEREARAAGGPAAGAATGGAAAAVLAPRLLTALTSLRSADNKYRVWTEAELREELDLNRDPAQADALRAALADLYRLNLVEPARNGWRARG